MYLLITEMVYKAQRNRQNMKTKSKKGLGLSFTIITIIFSQFKLGITLINPNKTIYIFGSNLFLYTRNL